MVKYSFFAVTLLGLLATPLLIFLSSRSVLHTRSIKVGDLSTVHESYLLEVPNARGFEMVFGIPNTISNAMVAGTISFYDGNSLVTRHRFDDKTMLEGTWLSAKGKRAHIIGRNAGGILFALDTSIRRGASYRVTVDLDDHPATGLSLWLFYLQSTCESQADASAKQQPKGRHLYQFPGLHIF